MRALLALLMSLALLAPAAGSALEGPLYGIDFAGNLYEVDPNDASLTLLGATGQTVISGGLATHPVTGRLWFGALVGPTSALSLVSVDPLSLQSTVEVTLVGFTDENTRDLTFLPNSANGDLYALGHTPGTFGGTDLYVIDSTTGTATEIDITDGVRSGGIAGVDGDTLLADLGKQTVDLTLGPPHPGSTDTSFTNIPSRVTQMALSLEDNDTYVVRGCNRSCSGELWRIDLDTKSGLELGTPTTALAGISVPEAGAGAAALAAGAALVVAHTRRARREPRG